MTTVDSKETDCSPVVTKMNDGSIMANWSRSDVDLDGECESGESQRLSDWRKSAEKFVCESLPPSYEHEAESGTRESRFCANLYQDPHGTGSEAKMTVAKYFPDHSENIEFPDHGADCEAYAEDESPNDLNECIMNGNDKTIQPVTGEVVDSEGWVPGFQTLHRAEMKYDGNKDGGPNTCDECHKRSTWEEKSMENLGGYKVGVQSSYKKAWIIANPRAESSAVSDYQFEGGFAGKCADGENWRKEIVGDQLEPEWQCGGTLAWSPNFFAPDLQVENKDEAKVGIVMDPGIFYDDEEDIRDKLRYKIPENSFSDSWFRNDDEDKVPTVKSVRMRCEPGSSIGDVDWGSLTAGSDYVVWNVPSTVEEPVFVNQTIKMNSKDTYSCAFEFKIDWNNGTVEWKGDIGNGPHEEMTAEEVRDKMPSLADDNIIDPQGRVSSGEIDELVSSTVGNSH